MRLQFQVFAFKPSENPSEIGKYIDRSAIKWYLVKSHDRIVHGFSRSMFFVSANDVAPFAKLSGATPCTDKEQDPVYFLKYKGIVLRSFILHLDNGRAWGSSLATHITDINILSWTPSLLPQSLDVSSITDL